MPPGTLPPEWEHDEDLPIFEFLEMERRTAIARLRQLTEEQRSAVFCPTQWTQHPDEPWTVRKALRRFLEHEREHTGQVREILAAQRAHLLARLDAERAGLLEQITSLDEKALTGTPVLDGWTVKDLLAHIAAWDRWELREMRRMLGGEAPDLTAVRDMDTFNAGIVAAWRDRTLAEVLVELQEARAALVAWVQALPLEEFFRSRRFGNEDWWFPGCLEVQWRHDTEHAAHILSYLSSGMPRPYPIGRTRKVRDEPD